MEGRRSLRGSVQAECGIGGLSNLGEQAAKELPKCPDETKVAAFLEDWANRAYTATDRRGPRKKHFGLPRATTLLHFISGGRYPIFDSRVRTAIARLLGQPETARRR